MKIICELVDIKKMVQQWAYANFKISVAEVVPEDNDDGYTGNWIIEAEDRTVDSATSAKA